MEPYEYKIKNSDLIIHHYRLDDREKIFLYENDENYKSNVSIFLDDNNPDNGIYKNVNFVFIYSEVSEELTSNFDNAEIYLTIEKNDQELKSILLTNDNVIEIIQNLDSLLS